MTDEKRYVIRTDNGTMQSQHGGLDQAKRAAEQANKRAEELEIKTRYTLSERS